MAPRNPQGKHSCDICGFSCSSSTAFGGHMVTRHDAPPNLCLQCGKTFPDKRNLARHVKCAHSVSSVSFHCTKCKKNFGTRADNARRHARNSKKGCQGSVVRRADNHEEPLSPPVQQVAASQTQLTPLEAPTYSNTGYEQAMTEEQQEQGQHQQHQQQQQQQEEPLMSTNEFDLNGLDPIFEFIQTAPQNIDPALLHQDMTRNALGTTVQGRYQPSAYQNIGNTTVQEDNQSYLPSNINNTVVQGGYQQHQLPAWHIQGLTAPVYQQALQQNINFVARPATAFALGAPDGAFVAGPAAPSTAPVEKSVSADVLDVVTDPPVMDNDHEAAQDHATSENDPAESRFQADYALFINYQG